MIINDITASDTFELEACEFEMEPEPTVMVTFEEIVEKYLRVLLLAEFTACQQMHQSVSTDIILHWSNSLLLRPEVSYLLLRNFAAVHHLTLLVYLITEPSHMLEV